MTLQTTSSVKQARDIRAQITHHLKFWEKGCYVGLVDNTVAKALNGISPKERDPENEVRVFNGKVLSVGLQQVVHSLTTREGGGGVQLDGICTKSGKPVHEVLWDKHPDLRDLSIGVEGDAFNLYPQVP